MHRTNHTSFHARASKEESLCSPNSVQSKTIVCKLNRTNATASDVPTLRNAPPTAIAVFRVSVLYPLHRVRPSTANPTVQLVCPSSPKSSTFEQINKLQFQLRNRQHAFPLRTTNCSCSKCPDNKPRHRIPNTRESPWVQYGI